MSRLSRSVFRSLGTYSAFVEHNAGVTAVVHLPADIKLRSSARSVTLAERVKMIADRAEPRARLCVRYRVTLRVLNYILNVWSSR